MNAGKDIVAKVGVSGEQLRRLIGAELLPCFNDGVTEGERWEITEDLTGEQAAILFGAVDRLQVIAVLSGYYLRRDWLEGSGV